MTLTAGGTALPAAVSPCGSRQRWSGPPTRAAAPPALSDHCNYTPIGLFGRVRRGAAHAPYGDRGRPAGRLHRARDPVTAASHRAAARGSQLSGMAVPSGMVAETTIGVVGTAGVVSSDFQ